MAVLQFSPKTRSRLFWLWILILVAGLGFGLVSGIHVLANGLGVTNLTDNLPWGLWITIDLSSIALGAGAFTLSAAVYLFGLKKYAAIARAAVFVGLLGYSSAMLALFMDIGRPDRFYHPLIYWNVHSVLWEITMCVVLYSTVLVLELVPIIIESTRLKNSRFLRQFAHTLHSIMPVAAVLGMGLSLLHQSSLGATYGILISRPVWYSPSAPVLFILSAVAAGPSLTVFLTLLASRVMGRQLVPRDVISGVARFIGFACLAYLYLKMWSWASTNYYSHSPERAQGIELLAVNTPYGFTFWWGEVVFGALLPAIILLQPRLRQNTSLVMAATLLIITGLVINRWNTTLSGFVIPLNWMPGTRQANTVYTYTPALVEWGVVIGIVCYGWLAFTLGVRFLRLYPAAKPPRVQAAPPPPAAPAREPSAAPQIEQQPQPAGTD